MAIADRLGTWLASPRARWLVPLAAVLFSLPALSNGLAFDDFFLRAHARGVFGASLGARLDAFAFVPRDPAAHARMIHDGLVPWFTSPDLRLAFFRPLSAASHLVDFTLLDRWPWVMHAESLALYAALVAIVAAVYRRFFPPAVATLGALLFAIDDAHATPVGWLSNRNALIAAALGFAAILAHDRWRRDRWKPGAVIGPIAFALALLGGEVGAATLAYLAAHALTLDPAPARRRVLALAPYAVIAVAWQIAYRALGYGVHGSGLYVDPAVDPVAYALAAPGHAAALLGGLLAFPPADAYNLLPPAGKLAMALAAAAFVAFVVRAIAPRLRAAPALRFFALGAVLSLAPVLGVPPSDRLVTFAGLGAFAIAADVIGDLRDRAPASHFGLRRAWIAIHLVMAPLLLVPTCMAFARFSAFVDRGPAPTGAGAELGAQTLIVVNAPTLLAAVPRLYPTSRPTPRHAWILAGTAGQVDVTREDARTLRVELGPDASSDFATALFRSEAQPLRVGDVVELDGSRAEVVRLDAHGAPVAVRYRFDRDLESGAYRWIAWTGSFVDFAPPAIGARIAVNGG